MKVKKTRKRILPFTSLMVLTLMTLAAMPASAQRNPDQPAPPNPLAAQADSIIYLPVVARITYTDLTIGAIEVTQAIQNLNNTVSLVASKATVARIYVQTSKAEPVSNVSVSLSATRNGMLLPGSPLSLGPKTVTQTWSRADLNTSYNFSLPNDWLSGEVTLQVHIDPNNLISEGDEWNNRVNRVIHFSSVPALSIKVVPIVYVPSGEPTFPAASSSFIAPGVVKMYPVSAATVSERAAITVSDDLVKDSSWYALLSRIATIKSSDNAPASQIYYGLVPLQLDSGYTWFRGGIIGIGYVGYRVAAGVASSTTVNIDGVEVANHEFGHNLGREHAPCNVSDPDPNYPYSGASIGQYGLQVSNMKLYTPSLYTDIMSYCEPAWISDYTYQALYYNQAATAAATTVSLAPAESLLVRLILPEDGPAVLQPTYTFSGIPDSLPVESDYMLELIDEQGALVASYPLPALHAEEENIEFSSIHAMVSLPGQPYAGLRIIHRGELIAARSLAPASQQALDAPTIQENEQGAVLRWGAADTPAIVRYTLDGGETWTTVEADYTGGELALDEQSLPEGSLHFEIILADQAGSNLSLDWEHTR